jgi:hypothetical protein
MNQPELSKLLANYYGTEQYYVNPLYRWLKYTDGVHAFVNNAGGGAYWFLDIVGTALHALYQEHGFLSITLTAQANRAMIAVTDGDDKRLYQKQIEYTDCPDGTYKFFLTDDVLMLTSEY